MSHAFIYVETDGDREAPLREFIYDGYVHARGRSARSDHAYLLWTRQGFDTLNAVQRNPWVTTAHMLGAHWASSVAAFATYDGWVEDTTYRGPPPTPWEKEAVELLGHSSVKVMRARWQGYWVMLMVSHTETDEKGEVGIIPLAMIVDPVLIEEHMRLVSPDGTDAEWEGYRGEAIIFPLDDGEEDE